MSQTVMSMLQRQMSMSQQVWWPISLSPCVACTSQQHCTSISPMRNRMETQAASHALCHVAGAWYELEGGGAGEGGAEGEDAGAGGFAYLGDDSGLEVDLTAATISEDAEGEVSRRKQAAERDPVTTLAVRTALRGAMDAAGSHHGAVFSDALNRLDPTIAAQLKAALGM